MKAGARVGNLRVAWRQSLGAGVLLGLALGCGWLARWASALTLRISLIGAAVVLALLGAGLMVSLRGAGDDAAPRPRRAWHRLDDHFTPAGLPFFAGLIVLGLAAVSTGNNLLYLIVSGLLAALLVSALVAALNLSGMVLRFQLPEEIFAAQTALVGFSLANEKRFWPAFSLTLRAAAPPRAGKGAAAGADAEMEPVYFAHLPGGASLAATSTMLFPRRGCYGSAAFTLNTRFPLGLLWQRRRFQSPVGDHGLADAGARREICVYPAPAAPPPAWGARLASGAAQARDRRGHGQEIHRIRPHQAGDSARSVHWKASARAGALRVREFQEESGGALRVRLALLPDLAPAEAEAALAQCAGLVIELTRAECDLEFEGQHAAADSSGLFLPLAPAAHHRRAVLDYLARLDARSGWLPLQGPTLPASAVAELLIDAPTAAAAQ